MKRRKMWVGLGSAAAAAAPIAGHALTGAPVQIAQDGAGPLTLAQH